MRQVIEHNFAEAKTLPIDRVYEILAQLSTSAEVTIIAGTALVLIAYGASQVFVENSERTGLAVSQAQLAALSPQADAVASQAATLTATVKTLNDYYAAQQSAGKLSRFVTALLTRYPHGATISSITIGDPANGAALNGSAPTVQGVALAAAATGSKNSMVSLTRTDRGITFVVGTSGATPAPTGITPGAGVAPTSIVQPAGNVTAAPLASPSPASVVRP